MVHTPPPVPKKTMSMIRALTHLEQETKLICHLPNLDGLFYLSHLVWPSLQTHPSFIILLLYLLLCENHVNIPTSLS